MTDVEAEAWAEALANLSEQERKSTENAAFFKGDFDGRFNR